MRFMRRQEGDMSKKVDFLKFCPFLELKKGTCNLKKESAHFVLSLTVACDWEKALLCN